MNLLLTPFCCRIIADSSTLFCLNDEEKKFSSIFVVFFLFAVAAKTHGIDVPIETPLAWMSEHLSYPDNFLHVCLSFEDVSEA